MTQIIDRVETDRYCVTPAIPVQCTLSPLCTFADCPRQRRVHFLQEVFVTEHSKPEQHSESASPPDELIKDLDIKVSAADAANVKGGDKTLTPVQEVTLNKSKVANKAADALDGYIRG